jgi:hypothetical protein
VHKVPKVQKVILERKAQPEHKGLKATRVHKVQQVLKVIPELKEILAHKVLKEI